jgi:hypothetical protein
VTAAQRLGWLLDAARGLEFLHVRAIVHGRLHGERLLLQSQPQAGGERVVVAGFSAAGAERGATGAAELAWTCPLVRQTGEAPTAASDMYSWGATLCEVLCYPTALSAEPGALQGWSLPAEAGAEVPPLLAACTARAPASRLSASACIAALEIALRGPDRWEFPAAQVVPLQELGSGEFGTVSKVAASGLVRPGVVSLAAAKTLRAGAPEGSEAEFLAEMLLMMKLRHPHLVCLLGVVTVADPLMLLLEYLPGGSLDVWLLANPRAELDEQLYLLYQVALGMAALHGLNILHRDLAARNVLVGEDLVCKVADYGLSREVTAERDY